MKRFSHLTKVCVVLAFFMQLFSCDNKETSRSNNNARIIKPGDIDTTNSCGSIVDDSLAINKLLTSLKNRRNLSRTNKEDELLMDVLVTLDDRGFFQKISTDSLIFIIQNQKFDLNRIQFNECYIQQEKILRKYPKSFKQKIFLLYFTEVINTLDSVCFYSPKRISVIGYSQ